MKESRRGRQSRGLVDALCDFRAALFVATNS